MVLCIFFAYCFYVDPFINSQYMTNKIEEKEPSKELNSVQSLSARQKMLFTMFCWGVQSWGQADNFKANGYDQKYIDARKAMFTGLVIYSVGILLFILLLL